MQYVVPSLLKYHFVLVIELVNNVMVSWRNILNRRATIIALLIVVTVVAFLPVFNNYFVNFDDPGYVTNNPQVRSGISPATILWSLTSIKESNWHPLTWISHALDCSLFGLDARYHHGMNLLIHLISSILLFVVMDRMTHARWPSAFVAIVFAVHPLHVESVAWVAERKDVLSTLFWMLTMLAYANYVRSPKVTRYILALGSFALGLLAKPMLVSLPFVLILLDYWPLGRFSSDNTAGANNEGKAGHRFAKILLEKAPFLFLSIASSVITYIVQQKGGSMSESGILPLDARVANAVVSYVQYLRKTLLPTDLAFFYPHPGNTLVLWQVGLVAFGLVLVTAFVWMVRQRHPYLLVGWFWFLGTLVPVIGIVQVGLQAMADRYMYIPIAGLAMMIAWGIPSLARRLRIHRSVFIGGFVVATILMIQTSRIQAAYWKNSITLCEHAIAVTSGNHIAYSNLGTALADAGRHVEAIPYLREAFRLRPNEILIRSNLARSLAAIGDRREALDHYAWMLARVQPDPRLHMRMGDVLADEGRTREAQEHFQEALRLDSTDVLTRCKLAELYSKESLFDDAKKECLVVLKSDPGNSKAHDVLGIIAGRQNMNEEAMKEFSEAIRCDSTNAEPWNDLGILYERMGKGIDAFAMYRTAVRLNPQNAEAQFNYGTSLAQHGDLEKAASHWIHCLEINPSFVGARLNLGKFYAVRGNLSEATDQLAAALQIDSNNVPAHVSYGNLLTKQGRLVEAERHFAKALQLDPSFKPAQEAIQRVHALQGRQ